jgi:hypothetical protein
MKTVFNRISVIVVAGCFFFVGFAEPGAVASAAVIAWGSAQNISGDSDVSTTGTLLYAYNFGSSSVASTTVNGVTFAPFALPQISPDPGVAVTVGDVSISEFPAFLEGNFTYSSAIAPYINLSAAYRNLLASGATAAEPGTMTLALGGLTPGQTYDFQWWSNNSTDIDNWSTTTAAATNSVTLSANTSGSQSGPGPGVDGGIGQYAVGTFTADNTSLSITFNGPTLSSSQPLINGFQLRTVAVPEPSTCASLLAGLACGGYSLFRRRTRA